MFPKAYLKHHDKENYPERDSIANIALARASANKEYSSKAPSKYLAKCSNEILDTVLKSHLVTDQVESGIFEDDFPTFIEYRSEQILHEIRRLTGEMTEIEADIAESELGDCGALRIKASRPSARTDPDVESGVLAEDGSSGFSSERIEDRISAWVKGAPGRSRANVREVDFLQMFEYFKVIKSNWSDISSKYFVPNQTLSNTSKSSPSSAMRLRTIEMLML